VSDEILNILKQNLNKILENTIPEKRQETQELLNSIISEIMATLAKLEKGMTETLEKIEKQKQN